MLEVPVLDRQRHYPWDLLGSQLNTAGESHVPEGDIILKDKVGGLGKERSAMECFTRNHEHLT